MHQTRNEMLKEWPVERKGTKYIAVSDHAKTKSVSLLFILRDILKLARTRKEVKYILRNGNIKVNSVVRKEEGYPVQVFDTLSVGEDNYRLAIENGKFKLKTIKSKEAENKIVKIIGKKMAGKNIIQMNLEDGQNFISKEKFNLGDSAFINLKERKVEKILVLKEGSKIEIVSGKYSGQTGKIKSIEQLTRTRVFKVQLNDKEVSIPLKTFLVIE